MAVASTKVSRHKTVQEYIATNMEVNTVSRPRMSIAAPNPSMSMLEEYVKSMPEPEPGMLGNNRHDAKCVKVLFVLLDAHKYTQATGL